MGEDDEVVARKENERVRRDDQHGQPDGTPWTAETDPAAKAQDQIADADFAVAGGNGPQLPRTADRDSARVAAAASQHAKRDQPPGR